MTHPTNSDPADPRSHEVVDVTNAVHDVSARAGEAVAHAAPAPEPEPDVAVSVKVDVTEPDPAA